MQKKLYFLLLLLSIVLIIPSGYSQEAVKLVYRPEPGLNLNVDIDTETVIVQKFMGIDQKIEMNMVMVINVKVLSVSDTIIIMESYYKRLAIQSISPLSQISIDTESIDNQEGIEYLRPILNKKFKVYIRSNGEVKSVEGLEKIIDDITKNMDSENPAIQLYKTMLNDAFGPDNIRNNMEYISPYLPEYPVSAGQSWNYERDSKTAQFDFRLISVSTLKEINSKNAIIQTNSSIISPENSYIEIDDKQARMSMKGTQIAETNINPASGIPKFSVIKQIVRGDLWVDMSDEGIGNVKVPMEIRTEIDVNVKRIIE